MSHGLHLVAMGDDLEETLCKSDDSIDTMYKANIPRLPTHALKLDFVILATLHSKIYYFSQDQGLRKTLRSTLPRRNLLH